MTTVFIQIMPDGTYWVVEQRPECAVLLAEFTEHGQACSFRDRWMNQHRSGRPNTGDSR